MRSWLSKTRHVYWLLGLIALALAYFVTQHLGLRYHVVHLSLDDRIPFCPVFVVFYILWYFYVPGVCSGRGCGQRTYSAGRRRRCFRARFCA